MPESKESKVAAPAKAAASAEVTKVTGANKVPEAGEGVVPASETAGAETEGGTIRLRDPEPVASSAPPSTDAEPTGVDESITNEPIEVRGRLVNPKPEMLGAVGELDPKGRSPEEFREDQLEREQRRQHGRRVARRAARDEGGRFAA